MPAAIAATIAEEEGRVPGLHVHHILHDNHYHHHTLLLLHDGYHHIRTETTAAAETHQLICLTRKKAQL